MSDYNAPKGFGCALAILALAACAVLIGIGLLIGWLLFGGGA